jgi:hypothetical protein
LDLDPHAGPVLRERRWHNRPRVSAASRSGRDHKQPKMFNRSALIDSGVGQPRQRARTAGQNPTTIPTPAGAEAVSPTGLPVIGHPGFEIGADGHIRNTRTRTVHRPDPSGRVSLNGRRRQVRHLMVDTRSGPRRLDRKLAGTVSGGAASTT